MKPRLIIKCLAVVALTLFLLWVGWTTLIIARQPSAPMRAHKDTEFLTTLVVYYGSLNHRLPTSEEGLAVLATKPANAGPEWIKLLDQPPLDPWGNVYQYRLAPDHFAGFEVFSLGPDGVESTDDIHPPPRIQSLTMRSVR